MFVYNIRVTREKPRESDNNRDFRNCKIAYVTHFVWWITTIVIELYFYIRAIISVKMSITEINAIIKYFMAIYNFPVNSVFNTLTSRKSTLRGTTSIEGALTFKEKIIKLFPFSYLRGRQKRKKNTFKMWEFKVHGIFFFFIFFSFSFASLIFLSITFAAARPQRS